MMHCAGSCLLVGALLLAASARASSAHAQEAPPGIEATVRGLVLMNGFFTSAKVNNSDVPQFVLPPDALGGPPASATGAIVRQSRLTAAALVPEFAGGALTGELDVDFFGGQQPSTGGRTFPLLRVRRAFAELTWRRVALLVGQESPPIAAVSPSSLASIGFPDFAGAGNLWLWIPQLRASVDLAAVGGLRLGAEADVLAPTSGDPQAVFFTQPDIAERSRRPYLQARVRAGWGEGDEQSEVSFGGHYGWLATGPAERVHSRALAASVLAFLSRSVELRAELFTGQALAGLGGGGIGQNFGLDSAAVETTGGWAQLNLRPTPAWEIGGGFGIDDPSDADLDVTTQRLRNLAYEGHVMWRKAPVVIGAEVRRLNTRYGGALGERRATHANLAIGFEF